MGKITEVIYKEIDPSVCSTYEAGEYYFYFNMIGVHDMFTEEYVNYEEKQIKLRNDIIGKAIAENGKHPKVDTTIFGISTMKDRAVIITEY